jgi:Holliday junction resolvasome RuvABC endonuclease subunit
MKILALDLGSTTGFAHNSNGSDSRSLPSIYSKTWATAKELRDQKARRLDRRGDIRIVRFYDFISLLQSQARFDAVVFEDVQFHTSTAQTQLWSSFRTTVWLAFPKMLMEAVPVGTLKKFATGSGSADKQAMLAALVRRAPELITLGETPDDNACDAAWLWLWAQQNISRAKI